MDINSYLQGFPATHRRSLCMGILNLTPDSFHDGGRYTDLEAALRQYRLLTDQGCDIIDVGGMSSRPGHVVISDKEELGRVMPLLEARGAGEITLSIDTDKLPVATAALAAGVGIINDCSGSLDSPLFELAAEERAPLIVMHRLREGGDYEDIVCEVLSFFERAMDRGRQAGMEEWQFILDPGLGFNKKGVENLRLFQSIPALSSLGRPVLIGYSHKRFVAKASGEESGASPLGNDAAAVYSVLNGAHIIRVHEAGRFNSLAKTARRLAGLEDMKEEQHG